MSLEQYLDQAANSSDELLDSAKELTRSIKRLRKSALLGILTDMPKAVDEAQQKADVLQEKIARAKELLAGEHRYQWVGNRYIEEVLKTASRKGIQLQEQDDYLYCQPVLIRVLPEEPVVLIDRIREKRVRPSVLVARLGKLQNKPSRFNSHAFSKSLHSAYNKIKARGTSGVLPLAEIYEILTLLPGQKREYSRHEFARDLYLLDCDHSAPNKYGRLDLHRARGNEPPRRIFSTVSKEGELVRYYGISFTGGGRR